MPLPALAPLIPLAAGLIGVGGAHLTNVANAREARRNRQFQERMSSTAHTRQVEDLRAAGLNPLISRVGGASSPGGDRAEMEDVVGRGVSSGMAAKMAMANLKLLEAQTSREHAQANVSNAQAGEIIASSQGPFGRIQQVHTAGELAKMNLEQQRALLPVALAQAKAQLSATLNSAEATRAAALLDQAALEGAKNIEELEKRLGPAGPAVRMLFELLRNLRGAIR